MDKTEAAREVLARACTSAWEGREVNARTAGWQIPVDDAIAAMLEFASPPSPSEGENVRLAQSLFSWANDVNDACFAEDLKSASRIILALATEKAKPTEPVVAEALREAEKRGEMRAIARLVNVARAIARQAGVGGRETAGAIASYLATAPDEIEPFVAGELSPLDFAGDWMRGGCLSWHAVSGKVVHPDELSTPPSQEDGK